MPRASTYPTKTTPVNADKFPISDSAASNATKNVTFGDIKRLVGRVPAPDPVPVNDGVADLDSALEDGNYGILEGTDPLVGVILSDYNKFELELEDDRQIVGSSTLIVPAGVIDGKAGDKFTVVDRGGGVSEIINYTKAAGDAAVIGAKAAGWVDFGITPSPADTKDFNGLTVTFVNDLFAVFPDVDTSTFPGSLVAGLTAATDDELTGAEYTSDNVAKIFIVAKREGTAMNSYTLTGGTADFTTSASTLEGGIDPPPTPDGRLASVVVDTNVGTKQDLYTVPADKECVITKVVVRSASASLGAMSDALLLGFSGGANDYGSIPAGSLANLTDGTFAIGKSNTSYGAGDPWIIGTATDVFGCIFNDTGITATVTIDVFGYLYDV